MSRSTGVTNNRHVSIAFLALFIPALNERELNSRFVQFSSVDGLAFGRRNFRKFLPVNQKTDSFVRAETIVYVNHALVCKCAVRYAARH